MAVRTALAAVGVLGLVAAAAACASSKSTTSDNRAASAKQSSVTLTVGDQVSSLKTLLTASGELAGTGYTVKFAEFQGAAPLFQAVKAGAVDTGYAADLPTLTAIAGGVPVKAVAALQSNGAGTAVLTQKDSTVTSVADLKGRTVVVSSAAGSVAQELLANVLKKAGLSYSDVHVEYLLPTAALAAFNAHKIDVWATFGVYQDTAQLAGARTLVDGENGLTSGIGLISATAQTLDDPAKKAALQDLLKRVNKALIWTAAHPAQYAADYASAFNLSPSIATQVVSQGSNALVPLSAMEIADIQNVSDVMSAIGGLPTDVSVAAHSDPTAYTAADETSSAKS
ncbi:sulfonate transport system substrate-binding protein [Catenulispora sp. GAS73]|uniref:ABC transporter substrate-binding protein n=1 Tax=Catenulispora sp. GAS73 TaxID=3156269 RepID=UPI00351872D9